METNFRFEDYYKTDFVDPLYKNYSQTFCNDVNCKLPTNLSILNPLTNNINEIKYNKGLLFKKQYSSYPCPMGFIDVGYDYCKEIKPTSSFFYGPKYKNILNIEGTFKDFTDIQTYSKYKIDNFNMYPYRNN